MISNAALAGAGGNWPTEGERRDPRVIAQKQGLYCGCACALMIAAIAGIVDVPSQDELYDLAGGRPYTVTSLADTLNEICQYPESQWRGQFCGLREGETYDDIIEILSRRPWIAQMQEPLVLSHLVLVEGRVNNELHILDPADPGTSYRMQSSAFLQYWTLGAVHLVGE
jgi:ABC-type bacteriocin/lantibiotic exporter with double-glycine peptidase domain